ncbi:hypothetical protein BJY04DRAFT_208169 [Aspergillus karnatakaensis]|uniref:isoamyl alcohol oxidase n=1 Tax=Aspergillus karnatakaensis TaxID=1810916 RepID=UPI003CCD912C
MNLLLSGLALFGFIGVSAARPGCKCTPGDDCWGKIDWKSLNSTVSGKLILNTPPAASCYPGPEYDKVECAFVNSQWSNTSFQADQTIGYSYPLQNNCPVVDRGAGQLPWGGCGLGPSPVYTINATDVNNLAAGIAFAQKNNVRLVIRTTGHDLLGKSMGYGSLQIWMRHLRNGIKHQPQYEPSELCARGNWTGAAFVVAGGYVWDDVHQEAFARDLIVVGGGDPTVGVIGGYIQGGGHSPATHDFGHPCRWLDCCSPCSHPDLFTAIRGGGGGTYGVVVSITVKAFPSTPVVAQSLVIVPKSNSSLNPLLEALTDVYSSYPVLSDTGFSGYGSWSISDPITKYGDSSSAGYQHALAVLNKPLNEAKTAFDTLLNKLLSRDQVTVDVQWFEFPSYSAYYRAMSGVHQPTGVPEFSMASRMFDKKALTSDRKALRRAVGTLAGNPAEATINQVLFVGGGKVLEETEYSGVNPAWRQTYLVYIVARAWLEIIGPHAAKAIQADITHHKYKAMRDLTPTTGSYLNEADRNNLWWKEDFYGQENYDRLVRIKAKYDPKGVFYCPTCVGSPSWRERKFVGRAYGPLCSV